jgi:HEAT repeat protein
VLLTLSLPACRSGRIASQEDAQFSAPVTQDAIDRDIASLTDASPAVREAAQRRLAALGDAAVPALLGALRNEKARWRVAEDVLPKHPAPEPVLIPRLAVMVADLDEDPWAKRLAAKALGLIGLRASAAVPHLVAVLAQGGIPDPAITRRRQGERTLQRAIVAMGPTAARPVAQLLQSEDTVVRIDAAWILEQLGRDAAPAIDLLEPALRDEWIPVRAPIARLLVAFDSLPPPLAKAALDLRNDEYPDIREAIAKAIEKFGLR